MSKLKNFIVHRFTRSATTKVAVLQTRDTENDIDKLTVDVHSTLLGLFNSNALNSGGFDNEVAIPPFEQVLDEHFNESNGFVNFVDMTKKMGAQFVSIINHGTGQSVKSGYLVFFCHEHNGKIWFSIVMLNETKGMTLGRDLSFEEIERLDLDKLHLAARIRLEGWKNAIEDKYISFRIGRANEIRNYFSDFIGCKEFTQAASDTKDLVSAIKECCKTLELDDIKSVQVQALADTYCRENLTEDGRVCVDALGKHLFPEHNNLLLEKIQGEPYNLGSMILISKPALKGLVRYVGKSKSMGIWFSSELLDKSVFYENGTLRFTVIPDDLRAALEGNG